MVQHIWIEGAVELVSPFSQFLEPLRNGTMWQIREVISRPHKGIEREEVWPHRLRQEDRADRKILVMPKRNATAFRIGVG